MRLDRQQRPILVVSQPLAAGNAVSYYCAAVEYTPCGLLLRDGRLDMHPPSTAPRVDMLIPVVAVGGGPVAFTIHQGHD